MKTIYVITGQTATGKTNYAIELAKETNGELINCDSRQVYKKLDIITGKELQETGRKFNITKKLNNFDLGAYHFKKNDTRIWLYDIVDPKEPFSSFDYRVCALEIIQSILYRNKTPIIVGGTYFYIKHLLYGTIETLIEPNEKLREELNDKSIGQLQNILKKMDLELFNSLNNSEQHNPHRLIRKIEILKSDIVNFTKYPSIFELLPENPVEVIGFMYASKEKLSSKIADRVEQRIKNGAIEEVEKLLKNGYTANDPGLRTIGYVQIMDYLQSIISFDTMKEQWINKEIQYAKRQSTFMKTDPNIIWQQID